MKTSLRLIIVIIFLQNMATSQPVFKPASLVLGIDGVPISASQIEEYTKKLPNGETQTDIYLCKIFRDAAGRMRIEKSVRLPSGDQLISIEIIDPVARFVANLDLASKTAGRVLIANKSFGIGQARGGIVMKGKKQVIEKLGKRIINDLESEGHRIKVTDEESNVTSVDESWLCVQIGARMLIEADSPSEHYSAKLLAFKRETPDPELFNIPPEYTIHDAPALLPF